MTWRVLENCADVFRRAGGASRLGVEEDERDVAIDEQDAVAFDFAGGFQLQSVEFDDAGGDVQQIVVTRGAMVFRMRVKDGQHESLLFYLPVGQAVKTEKLRPRTLEEHEIVGVVNDAHLVCVGIADTILGCVFWNHWRGFSRMNSIILSTTSSGVMPSVMMVSASSAALSGAISRVESIWSRMAIWAATSANVVPSLKSP